MKISPISVNNYRNCRQNPAFKGYIDIKCGKHEWYNSQTKGFTDYLIWERRDFGVVQDTDDHVKFNSDTFVQEGRCKDYKYYHSGDLILHDAKDNALHLCTKNPFYYFHAEDIAKLRELAKQVDGTEETIHYDLRSKTYYKEPEKPSDDTEPSEGYVQYDDDDDFSECGF